MDSAECSSETITKIKESVAVSPRSINSARNPFSLPYKANLQYIIHLIISDAQTFLHILFDFVLVLSQCHRQGLAPAICQSEQRR